MTLAEKNLDNKREKSESTLFYEKKTITKMDYSLFKEEDFCEDTDFIHWVISPTEESNRFWTSFQKKYPHKMKEIERASEFIKTLHFQEFEPSHDDLTRLKHRIWEDIQTPVRQLNPWTRPAFWAAAAVALLVMAAGIFWWTLQPTTYQTAYGEIRKITLADGSIVTLNASTKLKVADNLNIETVREVWLEGEAYFDIAKLRGAKFIVHTPEAQVEVLGTEFNVSTRRKSTKVVLHEGKVKLQASHTQPVVMKPGDMATVSDKDQHIQLKIVTPKNYDSWKESIVVLDDRPVTEIVQMLEDTYGISVQFENPLLLNKKLTGRLSLKSSDEFVENLATILETEVKKTEKGYLLK